MERKKGTRRERNDVILYESSDGELKISVKLEDETVWLTQQQLAELFQTSKQLISYHIANVINEGELLENSVVKKSLTTANDGKKYQTNYYNLDMIISLGYRINSKIATAFRQWATVRLKEYIVKGFTLDDERLKQNGGRYFRELLQRIRDIRSSERNLWQQVTDIYATAIDYDKNSDTTKKFFAIVQNKMHYAVHCQTAAEVIYNRVDAMEFKSVGREILLDNGKVSHEQAIEKADKEYDEYRRKEFEDYESDFDRAVEELTKETKRIERGENEAKI